MDFDAVDIERLRRRSGEKWRSYPGDVLPLWVADMDFAPAPPIHRTLADRVELGDLGYPVNPTPRDLPSVFARWADRRYGWPVDPERVEVLADIMQGIYLAIEVYSEPGDGAVIQTPIYPPFLSAVAETRRTAVFNTLRRGEARYEIDFDALRAAVGQRTRMLLLCHPHNPCGREFTRGELERIAELAIERDLIVLSDEIHADLVLDGQPHVPFAALGPEVEARTVTFMSASKAFNVAGLRCALAVFGSGELHQRFRRVPRRARGGLGILPLAVCRVAWEECEEWLEAALRYLRANRDHVAEFVGARFPGVRYVPAEATYFAWLDCRELELPGGPYRHFLRNARVALSDGAAFGDGGAGHVRLNFATSRKILGEALERMAVSL